MAGFKVTAYSAAHGTGRERRTRPMPPSRLCRRDGIDIIAAMAVWFAEMEAWLSRWSLDVMLLPINGRNPARRVAGNLMWGGGGNI
ncbi:MAG: hypothetical protein U1G07_22785 [Verrucomicrobiota bacterium]